MNAPIHAKTSKSGNSEAVRLPTGIHETRTFKSGNSVAVRLPKGFAIPANTEVELTKSGDVVTLRLAHDPAEAKRRMKAAYEALLAIGAPPDGVQARDPFDFPDRKGLL